MKKTNSQFFIIAFLVLLSFFLITFSKEVIESVGFSLSIWKENLFPSLFPFFVVSNMLIEYSFVDYLGKWFGQWMPKLFGLPKEASFVLFISMISGFPSSAKYTSRLVNEGCITKEEGEQLLTFTHFSNPLFILGFIGTSLLCNRKIAFLILFCHIFSNLIIGFLSKNESSKKGEKKRTVFPSKKEKLPFGKVFSKSIMDSLNTTFLLLGVVTCFLALTTILQTFLPLSIEAKVLISGLLEMTQGVKLVMTLPTSLCFQGLYMLLFISFGGFSVHMQVLSFISEENLRYFPYFWGRLLQVLFSGILYLLLFPILF